MAQPTLEHTEPPAAVPAATSAEGRGLRDLARRYPWWLGAAALIIVSIIVVRVANTRPGFDPYGWLTWGQQTLNLTLNTNAAPSWKPLPYVFTVPYALFGHYQLWLWMFTSIAISLSGMVFAARIAYRVTDAPADRRYAAIVAGLFAAVTLNLLNQASPDYSVWHYILSDQSDPMIVSLCLAAIDCHLCGRYRWAIVAGVLAGLGRPEVWALLGPYGIWAWRAQPQTRRWLIGGALVMAALWFGIPAISSRSPFVSADNAFYSGRRLTHDQIFGTIHRFLDLMPPELEVIALLSVIYAAIKRDLVTLALTGGVVVWMVIEVAMVLHGWPGVPRYMFEPAGLIAVIAAIGVGRLLAAPLQVSAPAGLAALGAAAVAILSVAPAALSDARNEHKDLLEQRQRTHTLNLLDHELSGYGGGEKFKACGEPLTRLQYQSSVAWALHRNVANIGWKYGPAIDSTRPIVLFTPYPQAGSGWQIAALRQSGDNAFCRSLPTYP